MIEISLPDGSVRQFDQSVTVHDVAKDIGEGLARAALAGKVEDELVDVSYLIQLFTPQTTFQHQKPKSYHHFLIHVHHQLVFLH